MHVQRLLVMRIFTQGVGVVYVHCAASAAAAGSRVSAVSLLVVVPGG